MRIALVATALCLSAGTALAQTREAGPWWPNPTWGRADQAGASNWITPEKVLEANLALDELARDGVYEFLFVFTPVRFKGATGSPGRPIAIR
jgi:kynurenine formamidase